MTKKTSVFIVPRSSTAWRGNEAGWITTSGWAAAGQQLWGEALVATTDGVFSPQQSMLFPRSGSTQPQTGKKLGVFRKFIPEFLITGYKDWALWRSKPSVWPIENEKVLAGKQVMMVWERHDLFAGPGRRVADKLGVPLVTSVEALVVWEAKKWGVKRPIWGSLLEKYGEAASLKKSDLVTCVSEEVKKKVVQLGVSPERIIVSPNRVDSSVFHPNVNGDSIKHQYRLEIKRVIGWTGSFRNFHGLDSVLKAFKQVHQQHPDTLLMLVGEGLEFEDTKRLARELNIENDVIFPGRQPFTAIPAFVSNFHIALVSASSSEGFHYSPLKLREYLACGKAVIAPRVGNLPEQFSDGVDMLFYDAGNIVDLADKINTLLENGPLHAALKAQAAELFRREGTWTHELKLVCEKLNIPF